MRCLLDRAGRNSVLQRDESFEPHPHKVFSLKVTSKASERLQPRIEQLLRRSPANFELRASTPEDSSYEVQLPGNTRTDALSKAIVALDEASAVEWEEKRRRTRHESAALVGGQLRPTQSSSEQQPARKAWAALQSPCSPSRL
jgi:hypothetical protein